MSLAARTKTYLIMAHLGALATISVFVSYGLEWPDFVRGMSIGLMIIPLFVMLLSRFRDEYIETLWQSGTSFAFGALVIGFVGLPFLEGIYHGAVGSDQDGSGIPAGGVIFVALIAFYTGFHIRWVRGLR